MDFILTAVVVNNTFSHKTGVVFTAVVVILLVSITGVVFTAVVVILLVI